jgi:RecA-family ATPase
MYIHFSYGNTGFKMIYFTPAVLQSHHVYSRALFFSGPKHSWCVVIHLSGYCYAGLWRWQKENSTLGMNSLLAKRPAVKAENIYNLLVTKCVRNPLLL